MKPFPALQDEDINDVSNVIRFIVRERQNDVTANNNLPQIYALGRKVGKVPASSVDVVDTDKIGDFNINNTYRYDLVSDGSGGAEWVRTAVTTW